ncbi:uncharacterized protein Tco025E_02767 [Trypanosoma conorhini]|uniref:Uncharacterized protein n=1 Tax=Trypanosoma conorhini TaxID=83891 RepID=A0A3S5ITW9_9TRYP|nr:uncharacterized protein Tco025E_02767 [Trypanosoma conorhini]RNF23794.1 hypothetical protein Tco025E_02767 [Trypanosoma conorhini]
MEDSGGIAQWSNDRSGRGGRGEMMGRGSMGPTGGSLSLSTSVPPTESRRQRTSSAAAQAKHGDSSSKRGSRRGTEDTLPPINSKRQSRSGDPKKPAAVAAASSGRGSASKKGRRATGSRSSTPRGSAVGKRRSHSPAASRSASRASSLGKAAASTGSKQRGKSSRGPSASRSRAGSRASTAKRRKSTKGKGLSGPGSRRRSVKGKKGKGRPSSARGGLKEDAGVPALASFAAMETTQRLALEKEEDSTRESFLPDYNLLVMNIVRSQLAVVNERQQCLNDTFKAMRAHGLQLASGQDPNAAIDMLRLQLQAEMQKQMDDIRVENGSLRGLLDEKKIELEEKTAEIQGLRDKVNRRLMRFEVESESLKAEVQSVLQTNQLDVDRMKRDLGHRLDVATATLRTPKYDTALRSMQEIVQSVQEEIQEHHDTLSKLIVSIGAQDTFLRDKSDSMHTNFPTRYRDELRKLDKDHLLNLLDVLSFHDAVVETVGKALYVLQKSEHTTNVF